MIRLVFKPVRAPVVRHEGLYGLTVDGVELLRVRARNAAHAERKFKFLLEREVKGKILDFNLEEMETQEKGKDNDAETADRDPPR